MSQVIRPSVYGIGFGAQQKKDSLQIALVIVLQSVFEMGLVAQKKDSDLTHAVVNTVAEWVHTAGPAEARVRAIAVASAFQVENFDRDGSWHHGCNHFW